MPKVYLFLICIVFFACSSEKTITISSVDIDIDDQSHPGLLHVNTDKAIANLGTNDSKAKSNESPQMKVSFSYDFFLGKHEVTCREFIDLIDYKSIEESVKDDCTNDSLPIANITYYDAVLFANARSKKENFDTVYTYQKASFDSKGHCSGLEGYSFHPDVNGYRLPTEAEWVLVAQSTWNKESGWTSENSDYKVHNVCSIPSKDNNFCDLKGNLAEWVNDWLGYFRDTTISNFVGAPDGGGIGERIVKGGSYRNSASAIQLYHRGDIYTVTSATKTEYVGFRLAFGSIPDPSWMNRNGLSVQSPATSLVSYSSIKKLTSSFKTKLAFRNDETSQLNLIDFSSNNPFARTIADSIDAYHPDFSPDGNYIAFCDVFEGISQQSSLYVYDLNSEEITKLNVKSAAIPRWTITDKGDTSIVYVTSAGDNKNEESFAGSETWIVSFSNGKFGAPEKLFNGNYHGGVSSDLSFAVSGSTLLRARINEKDTIWYNGEQACNASLSKDGQKNTLFLDFAGKTGIDFVGEKYSVHQNLLISDSTGKLIKSIAAPKGFTFDHTEWATNGNQAISDFIVATLTNNDGANKKIVLIDFATESITEIAEGGELWHPALWTNTSTINADGFKLSLDSAGIYYPENARIPSYELRSKMETFWSKPDSFTAVAFGSSRTLFGVNSKEVEHFNLLNFGYSGGDLFGIQYLFENYVLNHMHNVKYVILESVPIMFWRVRSMDWDEIYNQNPGFHYDESHNFWKDGVPEHFIDAVKDAPTFLNKETLPYNADFLFPPRSWGEAEVLNSLEGWSFNISIVEENYNIYKEIVQKANEAGIKVIALIIPVHPDFPSLGCYGEYGPPTKVAQEVLDSLATLDVVLMDEYNWGSNDYTDEMGFDLDHLSSLGATHLAHRLDSLLQTLE